MEKVLVLFLATVVAVTCDELGKYTSPKVQVYSHKPGEFGQDNTLICHVSGFHPPDITIQLMRDGAEISNAQQTDLAFEQNWHFHLTKNVAFKPMRGEKYSCKVTHGTNIKDFAWEPNM